MVLAGQITTLNAVINALLVLLLSYMTLTTIQVLTTVQFQVSVYFQASIRFPWALSRGKVDGVVPQR